MRVNQVGGDRRGPAAWITPGHPVEVCGVQITDGWIYVGGELPADPKASWGRTNAPCLINPYLKTAPPAAIGGDLGYWPSYRELTPARRGFFLHWLSGSRAEPDTPIGYVLLYFYGLERRLVVDDPDEGEVQTLKAEVERLRSIFGQAGGFAYRCERLLEAVALRRLVSRPEALAAWRPDPDAPLARGLSVPLKLAIACKVVAEERLDAELAVAGYLSLTGWTDSVSHLVKARAGKELAAFARLRFARKYPTGFRLRDRQTSRLEVRYDAASSMLGGVDWIHTAFGRLPDPTTLNWKGMEQLCQPLIEQLEPYARAVGGRCAPGSLEGPLVLPDELVSEADRARIDGAREELTALVRPVGEIDMPDLARRCLGEDGIWNLARLRRVRAVVARLGFAMEPDPDFGKVEAKAATRAWIFTHDPDAAALDPRLYDATLVLAAVASAASPQPATPQGYDPWVKLLAEELGVPGGYLPRLEARRRQNGRSPAAGRRLAKLIEPVAEAERPRLAAAASAVAGRLHDHSPGLMMALARFYDLLGVDRGVLYSDLHRRAGAGEGPVVVEEASAGAAFRIPNRPQPAVSGGLDLARIDRIARETQAVSATLAALYEEDEPIETRPAPVEASGPFAGLDGVHGELLSVLAAQETWSPDALDALCRARGLIAGAAVETLNDWAYDAFDDAVLEEGDGWRVNMDVLDAARRAGA